MCLTRPGRVSVKTSVEYFATKEFVKTYIICTTFSFTFLFWSCIPSLSPIPFGLSFLVSLLNRTPIYQLAIVVTPLVLCKVGMEVLLLGLFFAALPILWYPVFLYISTALACSSIIGL